MPKGKQSIRFSCTGENASLRSDPFPAPNTGRLSVLMWLKTENAQNQPPLRLAVEGVYDDRQYYVFAPVGLGQAKAQQLKEEWSQFLLQIDDLPATGLDKLRVRFDLMGPGKVWIDNVQTNDLLFSDTPERPEMVQLRKIVAVADAQLQSNKLGDCLHELDGYWPKFLAAYVQLPQGPVANQPLVPPSGNQPIQQAPAPPGKQATRPSGPIDWIREKL